MSPARIRSGSFHGSGKIGQFREILNSAGGHDVPGAAGNVRRTVAMVLFETAPTTSRSELSAGILAL